MVVAKYNNASLMAKAQIGQYSDMSRKFSSKVICIGKGKEAIKFDFS